MNEDHYQEQAIALYLALLTLSEAVIRRDPSLSKIKATGPLIRASWLSGIELRDSHLSAIQRLEILDFLNRPPEEP